MLSSSPCSSKPQFAPIGAYFLYFLRFGWLPSLRSVAPSTDLFPPSCIPSFPHILVSQGLLLLSKASSPGAKLHWKPVKVPNPEPWGKKTTKKYYYVCDIGPRGGILRQPRLSFRAKLEEDNPRSEDNNTHNISTTTPSLGK